MAQKADPGIRKNSFLLTIMRVDRLNLKSPGSDSPLELSKEQFSKCFQSS